MNDLNKNTITIEEQMQFMEQEKEASLELSIRGEITGVSSHHFLKDVEMYSAILDNLRLIHSNDLVLQRNCMHCKDSFITKTNNKQFCSNKCRVAYFRKKNRLKDFITKINKILSDKGIDCKFMVGVLIVPDGYCPYEVELRGEIYKGKTTRELLTKLRKL